MPEEDKIKRYELLEQLIEAGMDNFTFRQGSIQNKHLVCIVVNIDGKDIKITR